MDQIAPYWPLILAGLALVVALRLFAGIFRLVFALAALGAALWLLSAFG